MGIMKKTLTTSIMYRLLIITISVFYSCLGLASSSYQIDLILFAHPKNAAMNTELDLNAPLIPINKKAIPLTNASSTSYRLLPPSQSSLRNEYYLLTHKSHYQVLGHYSWKQTTHNQALVALPEQNSHGWQIQGTLNVQKTNYYQLNADLQCSSPSNPHGSFTVTQKQRLKDNTVYYLDHSQIGMLVKIHQLT
jgi:hypothetical protein